ncbi:putative membrane protein [Mucilaginibacter oryzae]|uniref:Putative membrane protein n=1 Tax=Mucilaginibacter oryzae TaxID=468058 RepID=A0A316HBA7_9SPHI|nr:MauE/DoxX family redox-associated membrane protein [Mucilaginibacter oryzae]PWK77563.1 putative membrane protein [Mucilaginibacter oryzae]
MNTFKKISLIILIAFYILAGGNHFLNPAFYYAVMPHNLLYPEAVNIVAGIVEIALGLLLISTQTRYWAAWGIILMLVAFLTVHVGMIFKAPFKVEGLTVTPLFAWLRLAAQFLLIAWVYRHTNDKQKLV